MDKFVRRICETEDKLKNKRSYKNNRSFKQVTIQSLSGVVVIEDIIRYKSNLEVDDQPPEDLIEILDKLNRKKPSKEVLLETKIDFQAVLYRFKGRTVHKLSKHPNAAVSQKAMDVYEHWKLNILSKINRPFIKVRSDLKTQKCRQKAMEMLADALDVKVESELVKILELEILNVSKKSIGTRYKRCVQKAVLKLRHSEADRIKISTCKRTEIASFLKRCVK